jgi:hypothetical protein
MSDLQSNGRLGLNRGLAIGGFFAAGSLLMVATRGISVLDDYHTTLPGLLAFNVIGGAITGAIVGVLLPVANRGAVSAALVGFVAMLPASVVGMLMVTPHGEWRDVVPVGSLAGAALLGGLGGPLLRSSYAGETATNWRFVAILVAVGAALGFLMHLAGWW